MAISKFLENSNVEGYGMYGDKQTLSTQMKNVLIKYLKYTILQKRLCQIYICSSGAELKESKL